MKYLTRILKVACIDPQFQYHSLCRGLNLTHLMFADDLLIFCKGTIPAITLLHRGFITFSCASGLVMNNTKSEIFYNEVTNTVKTNVEHISGFKKGNLPFRYLGVPMSHKKLTKMDCNILVEKIVSNIQRWATRNLSYAGRLVLVKVVLSTIANYWSQIFILPSGVLVRVQARCRNFLWAGGAEYVKAPLINWKKTCQSKKAGDLGL